MCRFISRMRAPKKPNSLFAGGSAILNRERLKVWRAKHYEATGKLPSNTDLIAELDQAIEIYNEKMQVRVVV